MSVEVKLNIDEVMKQVEAAQRRLLEKFGAAVVDEAQDRCKKETGYTASTIGYTAPGEAGPGAATKVVNGKLRSRVAQPAAGPNEVLIYCAALNAMFLELGTKHMAAQPFLTPAYQAVLARINSLVESERL